MQEGGGVSGMMACRIQYFLSLLPWQDLKGLEQLLERDSYT